MGLPMAHDLYDLTQHPPRSPRVRLGGLVILPRMIDKARATKAGKNGEYNYGCSLDRNVLDFLGIEAEALKAAPPWAGVWASKPTLLQRLTIWIRYWRHR